MGAVKQCDSEKDQFLSEIVLVPKPNGESRLIFNLKLLNTYLKKPEIQNGKYLYCS